MEGHKIHIKLRYIKYIKKIIKSWYNESKQLKLKYGKFEKLNYRIYNINNPDILLFLLFSDNTK